jgi:hypothetical protein
MIKAASRLIFAGILVSATVGVKAQKLHIGATSGINTTFILDKGLSEDPRYNSTYTYSFSPIGLSAGVDFSPRFGLQLESILTNQAQIFEVIDFAETVVGERRIDIESINIPLLFKFMSGSTSKARMNFSLGPQLAIITDGQETLEYAASTQEIPPGVAIPEGAIENGDGTYDVPALSKTELLSTVAANELEQFKKTQVQIAGNIGLDIDITDNIYLSTLIRANYSLTDMRNDELIALLKNGNNLAEDIFGRRANLLVGFQFGVHYMLGGVWSGRR